MLCSFNWLKEYVTGLGAPKAAAEALTMSGAEVEAVHETGVSVANVVTAEVLTVVKHPNADKLSVCDVKADGAPFSIVCGAKNMKPGDKVVLALPGAELPGGFKIKKSRIRGVESEGMMCSEVELGIAKTSEGIMILPPDTPIGRNLSDVLGSDSVFELNVTPNRADLLSIKGVARELAAVTGAQFKDKETVVNEEGGPIEGLASVSISGGAPCARYCARVVSGVTIGPSPDAVRKRLEAAGIRSINNVVDATNYVMLETGQPLHAFDLSKLTNANVMINVRLASDGETIDTIDGKARALDPSMLVIADGQRPVALAGVMGGRDTEVTDSTRDILLEAAWFEPSSIRKTSKKTGVASESSYRFERGVDIEGVRSALDMAAAMIVRLAGGVVAKGVIDVSSARPELTQIRFRKKKVDALLGIAVAGETCLDIFTRIGVRVESAEDGVYVVTPPSFRSDLKSETDLIEEIARIHGYGNIPAVLPAARLTHPAAGRLRPLRDRVAGTLTGAGFDEVVNYSFVSRRLFEMTEGAGAHGVELLNPLSDEQAVMRASLVPSLLENLCYNLQRKTEDVRIYELAPVFALPLGFNPPSFGVPAPMGAGREGRGELGLPPLTKGGRGGFASDGTDGLPVESWKISGLMHGPRYAGGWNVTKDWVDFYDCKGVVERLFDGFGAPLPVMRPLLPSSRLLTFLHPGKSAVIMLNGKEAGYIGEAHPEVMARLDIKRPVHVFELDAATITAGRVMTRYAAVSKFPESVRDIAFIISDSVPYENIVEEIKALDAKLIESVSVFDVYYGSGIPSGSRSMALRIVYRSSERTLTSAEVDALHARVAQGLADRFKAAVRGEKGS
ncbi:MAG: phenylalanine--tRNA ligase subunit beta [Deltaproteobacteria bacterium]|nr:phenylalanine--tRNA ligase subunit beta [Deltaproteobacteria bacterium]